MKQVIEIEVDIPDGFRFKRFGKPKAGETSTDGDGVDTYTWVSDSACNRIIIEREPVKYREPDSRDCGKEIEVEYNSGWTKCHFIGKTQDGRFAVEGIIANYISVFSKARVIDDMPPEPAYRDATEADIGRGDVEFRDSDLLPWQVDGKLLSLYPNDQYKYEGTDFNWKFARVRVS